MFGRKRELTEYEIQLDKEDRQADKFEISLHITNGEVITYNTDWRRFNQYRNGITSFKELILNEDAITVRGVTYNTSQIVKITHKYIGTKYVKSEIKKQLKTGGAFCNWAWKRAVNDNDLED